MTLTAKQIIDSAFPIVKKSAKYVVLRKTVQKGFMKSGAPKAIFTAKSTADANGNPIRGLAKTHKVAVWAPSPREKLHLGPVLVTCDCEYFCFNCEVALAKKGASLIHFSNGEHPEVTNPRLIPSPCKHVYVALIRVLKEKDNL